MNVLSRAMLLAGVALFALQGCAWRATDLPARPPAALLPSGSPLLSNLLPDRQAWLRHHLVTGTPDSALELLGGRGAGDALLVELDRAVALRQAGRLRESTLALDRAEALADHRFSRSLGRAAGSFLVNDRVLEYQPGPTERLMIPYYRMLNYLDLGDVEGAVVEARRAAAVADQLGDEADLCQQDALLTLLGAYVFEMGGEHNDAEVAFRRAARLQESCGASAGLDVELHGTDSAGRETGEVILVIEEGFVAHRVARSIHVPVWPDEVEGLASGQVDGILAAAASISARFLGNVFERAHFGWALDDLPRVQWEHMLDGAHLMKVAWPATAPAANRPSAFRVAVEGQVGDTFLSTHLSARVVADLEAERLAIVTRGIGRALAKTFVSREVERRVEKEHGEMAGFVAGLLTNAAVNALEEADTRSWALLPDRLSLVRLRLPAGSHSVVLEVAGALEEGQRTIDLGPMEVSAGERRVLSARLWGAEPGDEGPLLRARERAWTALAGDG